MDPDTFSGLTLLLLMFFPLGFFGGRLARRKRKSNGWFTLLCAVPYVNAYAFVYLASLPDKGVARELHEIRIRLVDLESSVENLPKLTSWTCGSCANVNPNTAQSCIKCNTPKTGTN